MSSKYLACVASFSLLLLSACSDSGTGEADKTPDEAAIAANNRAVGLMGRFEYADARSGFAAIVDEWPVWHDARLNLAIATLNTQEPGSEIAAAELAQQVLEDEPGNLRAHYIAGLVQLYLGAPDAALQHFHFVAENDAQDAHAAYYLAQSYAQLSDYQQALDWYGRAMREDPYLRSAYYGAFQSLQRLGRADEARALAADYQRLENNPRSHLAEFKYTRMGPKGSALTVDLETDVAQAEPQGPLFLDGAPLRVDGPQPDWQTADQQVAPGITAVDMQGDGVPDLFITNAVAIAGGDAETRRGNLVLQGSDDGAYEVLEDSPLTTVTDVNAALWGDYDNDGRVDVYLSRRGKNQLWRQSEDGAWEDVTAATGTAGADLDTRDGAFFDADHDGDLDLFLVNSDGPNELLNNNLDGTFRPLAEEYGLAGDGSASSMVLPVDLDSDRDADLIILNRDAPHEVFINDRLWSYRPAEGFDEFRNSAAASVIAADIDADGMTELYTIADDGVLLRWQADTDGRFRAARLRLPDDAQSFVGARLAAFDVNGDGRIDLVVSTADGWTVLTIEDDTAESMFEVRAAAATPQLASLPLVDPAFSGPSMLALAADPGELRIWRPGSGRFPFLTIALTGKADDAQSMRSNASGIGAGLGVRTGSRWSLLPGYRNHSAPGQSLQPLSVGLRGARRADFVAIDWSDGVFQSEVDVPTGELLSIAETQRQLSSCPVLFAWNGSEYVFVSDILGVGGMGYAVAPGQYATPRPRESYLLPDGLLQPQDDRYVLKIGEPMEENAYIDAVRLAVYDVPAGWQVVLDERMGISPPEPTGAAFFFKDEILPDGATNDRGTDVLDSVVTADGVAAPVGELDARFIGRLQSEHVLILDFEGLPDHDADAALLVIDGWVEYPYSQTNFAAWQAGAAFEAPTLEAHAEGEWQVVAEQFGYPAGMPRRMSLPLRNLPSGTSSLRLRTNMQIYWDRIAIAFAAEPEQKNTQIIPLADASLRKTGFAARTTFDQFRPYYDYARLSPFWDTRYMSGYYTRLGPATELVSDIDDAVAIIGPGVELHIEFDIAAPAPEGWQRFYVLESNGWAKDMDLFTRDGDTVGPLPDTGKPAGVRDRLHQRYNTRYQSGY